MDKNKVQASFLNSFEQLTSRTSRDGRNYQLANPSTNLCRSPPLNLLSRTPLSGLSSKIGKARFRDAKRGNSLSMTWLRNEARIYHHANCSHVAPMHRRFPRASEIGRLPRVKAFACKRSSDLASSVNTRSGQRLLRQILLSCSRRRQERNLRSTTHSRFATKITIRMGFGTRVG